MRKYKNKMLQILGFGSMDYNTIKDTINRTLYTYTNEDTTPSEKRILGQMLLTIADHEQNERRKEWEEEETKGNKAFDIRTKLNPVPFTDGVK